MSVWLVKPIFNSEEQGEVEMKLPCSYKSALRMAKEKTGADEVVIKPKVIDESYCFLANRSWSAGMTFDMIQCRISDFKRICSKLSRGIYPSSYYNEYHREKVTSSDNYEILLDQMSACISYIKNYLFPIYHEKLKSDLDLALCSEKIYYQYDYKNRDMIDKDIERVKNARQKTSE